MIEVACLVGLGAIALLSLWDSYLLTPVTDRIVSLVESTSNRHLIRFIHCDYCIGFWLCLLGCLLAGKVLLTLPAYGVVVLWLTVHDAVSDE